METTVEAPVPAAPSAPATPAPAVSPQDQYQKFLNDSNGVAPDVLNGLTPMPTLKATPRLADLAKPAPAQVAPPAQPATPEVAPLATPEPVAEQPAPPAQPEPAKEQSAEEFTKNWRLTAKNAKQAMVLELLKKGIDPQEAVAEVYGTPKAEAEPSQPISEPAPQPDPVAEVTQRIDTLAAQVAELDAQIEKASEEGDNKAATKLLDRKLELRLQLERAKDNRELIRQDAEFRKEQATAAKLDKQVQSSLDQMYETYPQLADKNSEQRAQFNLKVRELEAINGKDFRTKNPGWPMMVARIVDAEQRWSLLVKPPEATAPAAKPMSTPAKLNPAPIPAPPVRATAAEVITPSANQGGATPPVDKYSFIRDTKDVPPDVLLRTLSDKLPIDPRLTKQTRTDYRTWENPR